jgi:hypothetical protein
MRWEGAVDIVRHRDVPEFHAWSGGHKERQSTAIRCARIFATAANYETIEAGEWSSERGGDYE